MKLAEWLKFHLSTGTYPNLQWENRINNIFSINRPQERKKYDNYDLQTAWTKEDYLGKLPSAEKSNDFCSNYFLRSVKGCIVQKHIQLVRRKPQKLLYKFIKVPQLDLDYVQNCETGDSNNNMCYQMTFIIASIPYNPRLTYTFSRLFRTYAFRICAAIEPLLEDVEGEQLITILDLKDAAPGVVVTMNLETLDYNNESLRILKDIMEEAVVNGKIGSFKINPYMLYCIRIRDMHCRLTNWLKVHLSRGTFDTLQWINKKAQKFFLIEDDTEVGKAFSKFTGSK